jgi:hypothetical protein
MLQVKTLLPFEQPLRENGACENDCAQETNQTVPVCFAGVEKLATRKES